MATSEPPVAMSAHAMSVFDNAYILFLDEINVRTEWNMLSLPIVHIVADLTRLGFHLQNGKSEEQMSTGKMGVQDQRLNGWKLKLVVAVAKVFMLGSILPDKSRNLLFSHSSSRPRR
jgi:hypothetical protein